MSSEPNSKEEHLFFGTRDLFISLRKGRMPKIHAIAEEDSLPTLRLTNGNVIPALHKQEFKSFLGAENDLRVCQGHTVSCIAGYLTWIPGGVVANAVPGR
jgi:hypothetical protein